ncbi:MAG: hydroxyacid dehydrogenase [Paracoccaceae bacterium]|nr:hydroxyacid dehydrogenase [Paracoccaceae bacterium]
MVQVLVTEPVHPDALALLRAGGCKVIYGPNLDAPAFSNALAQVEILLVRILKLDPTCIAAPLRMVSKHGVGVDNIPLEVARVAGIAVANTPGANTNAVAEHTLMLMLALAKSLPQMTAAALRDGRPDRAARVVDLAGRRLLLIGYGRTARRVAALAKAFGMSLTVMSPRLRGVLTPEGYAIAHDLHAALQSADVLSLHCPLTPATQGLIGAAELALLPRGAHVINTARGGLIDEAALAAATHLGGFAVDVVAEEPIRPDNLLLHAANGIVTPHSAAMSAEAFRQMGMDAAQNILDYLAGRLNPAHTIVAGH